MTIRVTVKQDLHVVKEIGIAVDLQNLRRAERCELMEVHPLVQHRIAHEGSKSARFETSDGVFIGTHLMNGYALALESCDKGVRMFPIKEDVDRYDSVIGTQALHAVEKLVVVIGRLWRTGDGK